jgi:hypothetical protein
VQKERCGVFLAGGRGEVGRQGEERTGQIDLPEQEGSDE